MGFFEKYGFPNQMVFNHIVREGGGECAGSASIEVQKAEEPEEFEKTTKSLEWEWGQEVGVSY